MLLGDKAFLPPPSLRPEASCRPSCCYSGAPPGLMRAPPSFPPAALAATWEAPSSWRKWANRLRVPRGLPQARSSAGGRPHPEGRVTGKLRLKNETRSPQPSARLRRWGSGGAGDGHAADPRVRGCRTVSDVSVADPHTSALTCSGRERPKGGQQRQVADMPGASRELPG